MDIAALSIALSRQNFGVQAGIAVTKLTTETNEQTMTLMTDMLKSLELSVNPHLGSSIDLKL